MEVISNIDGLFWSDSEARIVAGFIKGNNSINLPVDRLAEWQKLKLKIVIPGGGGGKPALKEIQHISVDANDKEVYEWSAKKRVSTLLTLIDINLRKSGIWDDASENRRTVAISGLRDRRNFFEDELVGDKISKAGYVATEEGGPHIIAKINIPKAEATKKKDDARVRESSAHEATHVIRAFTNKNFWAGFEEECVSYGLTQSQDIAKQKVIGGFYVGSNLQGSESVGQLFSLAVQIEAAGKIATIENVLVNLKPGEGKDNYSLSRAALNDHLKQLASLGLEQLPVYDIVALGTFGYVSFEKIPSLIKLGILSPEKFSKMKIVIRNIGNWLTEGALENI